MSKKARKKAERPQKVRTNKYNTSVPLRLVAMHTGFSYGTVLQYAQRDDKKHIIDEARTQILQKLQSA